MSEATRSGAIAVLILRDKQAGKSAFVLKSFSRPFCAGGQASGPHRSRESRLSVQSDRLPPSFSSCLTPYTKVAKRLPNFLLSPQRSFPEQRPANQGMMPPSMDSLFLKRNTQFVAVSWHTSQRGLQDNNISPMRARFPATLMGQNSKKLGRVNLRGRC